MFKICLIFFSIADREKLGWWKLVCYSSLITKIFRVQHALGILHPPPRKTKCKECFNILFLELWSNKMLWRGDNFKNTCIFIIFLLVWHLIFSTRTTKDIGSHFLLWQFSLIEVAISITFRFRGDIEKYLDQFWSSRKPSLRLMILVDCLPNSHWSCDWNIHGQGAPKILICPALKLQSIFLYKGNGEITAKVSAYYWPGAKNLTGGEGCELPSGGWQGCRQGVWGHQLIGRRRQRLKERREGGGWEVARVQDWQSLPLAKVLPLRPRPFEVSPSEASALSGPAKSTLSTVSTLSALSTLSTL